MKTLTGKERLETFLRDAGAQRHNRCQSRDGNGRR